MDRIITIDELLQILDKYNHKELHVHHTWSPNHTNWNQRPDGLFWQQSMRNYHVNTLGWQDIGQHVTLLPNGLFVTGRDFGINPASISGYNTGGFAMEMLGNFDIGNDNFTGSQKESALKLAKYFLDKGRYVRFHRENAPKTCPGTSIDKEVFISEAKNIGQVQQPNSQPTNSEDIVYIVKSGDTLSKIGVMYGVSYQKIASDNGITNPSIINIGQRLVIKKAIQTPQPTPIPQPTPVVDTNKYGVVTASVLNVRSGRGTQYGIIGQLKNGEKVRLDQLMGDWWSIYYGSHGGFVHKNYIQQI